MTDDVQAGFFEALGRPFTGEEAFDALPDVVFFLKDGERRYVAVNQTLVERCGRSDKTELIGRTAEELFPAPLGGTFAEQDATVLHDGQAIRDRLELHLYPGGQRGWCLTSKMPLIGAAGTIAGLAGVSRDVQPPARAEADLDAVSKVLEHVRARLDQPLHTPALAALAALSPYQLDQRIRALFGMTTAQYVMRARIEIACDRLRTTRDPISDVALGCGYGDQGAFTRQFRQTVGMPPKAYRDRAGRRVERRDGGPGRRPAGSRP